MTVGGGGFGGVQSPLDFVCRQKVYGYAAFGNRKKKFCDANKRTHVMMYNHDFHITKLFWYTP